MNIAVPEAAPEHKADVKPGWKAALSLSFERGPARTVVRRSHTGPLTIQRPFYPEGSVAHVYMLHPPGGVVGGDGLSINVTTEDGGAGLVTTPGATKFYRSAGLSATLNQQLRVEGGSLEWFPQENIFYNDCSAELNTTVDVSSGAALALWDIQCFGRPAGNAPFNQGHVCNTLTVLSDGVPQFIDRLLVNEDQPLSRVTGLRGHTVSGTLLLNNMSGLAVDLARKHVFEKPEFFITLIDSLVVVRYIGDNAYHAKTGFSDVWSCLRPTLNQQTPCVPRIWAT